MIKAIIFDWLDTLSSGIPEGYFPIERIKRKFKLSDKTINQCLGMLNNLKVPFEPTTIEQQRQILIDFWQSSVKKINIENPDLFIKYILEWSFDKSIPDLLPGALDVIDDLSRKNYKMVILTNGWPARLLEIKRSKISKYFKTILISSVIGAKKPEVKAYQTAINQIGVSSNQILFTDDKEEYLVPAKNLGMKVVLMDKENFYPESKFPKIRHISSIKNYLK